MRGIDGGLMKEWGAGNDYDVLVRMFHVLIEATGSERERPFLNKNNDNNYGDDEDDDKH